LKKNQINKMNKKKLQSGLIIVAIIFPLIFIGPSIFLMGNMNGETEIFEKKNLKFLISGLIIMLSAICGLFIGLKKILNAIFEKESNE
tara:strand:- start:1021 stop:1284 length:264 start_codon:yes stop_codon:yes gene_type:complete